jgi:pimeloyl-ACP methyl ester carboxylesterase
MYPWIPIGPFFEHELDSAEALKDSTVPVAIIAAERDEIVPADRTQALRGSVPNIVFDRTIAAAGHNDIYRRSDFQAAMDQALEAINAVENEARKDSPP